MTALVVRADARSLPLPDASVDLVVTSPPYYGLREYRDGGELLAGQVGLEDSPLLYLDVLLECVDEWLRVLRPGGSIFVNLGDKRADRAGGRDNTDNRRQLGDLNHPGRAHRPKRTRTTSIAPRGSRLMLPERFALACVDKLGLSVRQSIIWDKPSAVPESVRDRCRDSHETIYHLVRADERYYAAVDRIRVPHAQSSLLRAAAHRSPSGTLHPETRGSHTMSATSTVNPAGALPGSVWRIPSVPLDVPAGLGVDHFAAFPPDLARRAVLGWSPERRCLACGAGLRPVIDNPSYGSFNDEQQGDRLAGRGQDSAHRNRVWRRRLREGLVARIVGEACGCADPGATVPGVVVDPFGGTGTTALVAHVTGRVGISADLSHDYGRIAQWRTADPRELARALDLPMPPAQADGQEQLPL